MSIQNTINQGVSLMGLLLTQTSLAKQREANAAAERQREIKEGRIAEERENIKRLFSEHSALVRPIGKNTEKWETVEEHIGSRRNALKYGQKLQEFEPTAERGKQLAEWEAEIGRLKDKEKYFHEVGRKEIRAEKKKKKREEAEASAMAALEEEQRRQEITREITRPFDPTTDEFK